MAIFKKFVYIGMISRMISCAVATDTNRNWVTIRVFARVCGW